MSRIPEELRYNATHQWARKESDGSVTVGITDFAQDQLGDVVFVELPEVGAVMSAGEDAAVAESVKSASDVYTPVGGKVTAVNPALEDAPELLNESPYYQGWLFQVEPDDPADWDKLLDADGYAEVVSAE